MVYEVWDEDDGKMVFGCQTEEDGQAWVKRQADPSRYAIWEADDDEDDDDEDYQFDLEAEDDEDDEEDLEDLLADEEE